MRIRERLRLTSFGTVAAVMLLLVVLSVTTYRVNRALEKNAITDAIVTGAFERLLFRTDYYHSGSERSKAQLIAKHKQLGELIRSAARKFSDPEDQKIIKELLAVHESTGELSRTIRSMREKRGLHTPLDPLSQELENRLFTQLNMKVYETILLDNRLLESSNRALVRALWQAGGGTVAMLLLLCATTLVNVRVMHRSIAGRMQELRNGAAMIGEGHLEHRIDLAGDDEFTELADSFNEMTVRLRDSRNTLETEIEERKRAEDKLHAANADLAASRSEAVKLLEQAQVARREAERASADLRQGNQELTLLNRAMVGRELRMIELKEEVNALCVEAGEPPRYPAGGEEEG